MGDSLEESPSCSEIFDKLFPIYLSYGMTYDLYWNDRPELAKAYREAHKLNLDRKNQELWLEGAYTYKALDAALGGLFTKKGSQKPEYLKEPLPITKAEIEKRKVRDMQEKQERIKEKMLQAVANINRGRGE